MKASELIAQLQDAINHGEDLEVVIHDESGFGYSVEYVDIGGEKIWLGG